MGNLKRGVFLILFVLIPIVVGFLGSIFTAVGVDTWYRFLVKPPIAPPDWIFGPVWSTLYILMGIAAFLVWNKGWKNKTVKIGLTLFLVQLGFNMLWSYLFFALENPLLAFVEIIILWIFILVTMLWFNKNSRTAVYLMLPYILWVSFAAILNLWIVILN